MARVKYIAALVLKAVFAVVNFGLTSEGMRLINPSTGKKLSTLPTFTWFANSEELYRLDYAHLGSLVLVLLCFVFASWIFQAWFTAEDETQMKNILVLLPFAAGLISLDCFYFYFGIIEGGWVDSGFSRDALMASLGNAGMVIAMSLMTEKLKLQLEEDACYDESPQS